MIHLFQERQKITYTETIFNGKNRIIPPIPFIIPPLNPAVIKQKKEIHRWSLSLKVFFWL